MLIINQHLLNENTNDAKTATDVVLSLGKAELLYSNFLEIDHHGYIVIRRRAQVGGGLLLGCSPSHLNRNLRNTDFVGTMISNLYVIYPLTNINH